MTSAADHVGQPTSAAPGARAGTTTRRRFLTGAAAVGVALPVLGAWGPAGCEPPPLPPNLPDGLFALGVASGDPLPDRVILWTRLAPAPLAGGGMPPDPVPVRWEVADDDDFSDLVCHGTVVAEQRWAHSVHVDVADLRPGRWYSYRFVVGDQVSPIGRTRTAPAAGQPGGALRYLFASCQNWQSGYWPLWANAPQDEPDVVLHLGDYIYEGGISANAVRPHNSTEVRDLAAYRNRYGLYKGDPALQAAHAACPWIVTWDDHEVENNYADLVPQVPGEVPDFAARRAAAYQAWWEHMPVRVLPWGTDMPIHRRFDWGTLARFHVVDTRQFRDPQVCGGSLGPTCPERTAPERTLLGADQESWLATGLAESPARWDVIANQIVMTAMPFAGSLYNPDQWDGYAATRTRLFQAATAAQVENLVVLSGDIHAAGVADLVDENPDGTPSTVAHGTELVGGSISSTFDPALADVAEQLILQLPHVRFADTHQRGYMVCDVTGTEMVTRYRVVESALVPTSPVTTAGTWVVESGGTVQPA